MCRIFTTLEICIDIGEKNLYDKDTRRKKFLFLSNDSRGNPHWEMSSQISKHEIIAYREGG